MSNYAKIPVSDPQKAIAIGATQYQGVWVINKEKVDKEQLRAYLAEESAKKKSTTFNSTQNSNVNAAVSTQTNNAKSWSELLSDDVDKLYLLLKLKADGLPTNVEDRVTLLQRLSGRANGTYPIRYDDICRYSSEFAEVYSEERVLGLIQTCIMGRKSYDEEIRESSLSDEEKALLIMILPIG